jgi:hypothetical protein
LPGMSLGLSAICEFGDVTISGESSFGAPIDDERQSPWNDPELRPNGPLHVASEVQR